MPVVQIHALRPPEPEQRDIGLSAIVDGIGSALGTGPSGIWVQWVTVDAMHTGSRPRAFLGHCPVVTIRAKTRRTPDQVGAALQSTATAVAAALDLSLADVWVHWQALAPSTVFAGGALQE